MLKQAINEIEISVELLSTSPLLVRDGRVNVLREEAKQGLTEQASKAMAAALPVSRSSDEAVVAALRQHAEGDWKKARGLEYYIPGSSLRGAWRSHLEREFRGLDTNAKVCDPLLEEEGTWQGCSKALEAARKQIRGKPYRWSCPICRLFGCTEQSGRAWVGDATRMKTAQGLSGALGQRDHVAIDRKSGGPASQKLFRELVLEGALWETTIRIRNFELFHVYLIGSLMNDLEAERAPVGGAKSRGYGRLKLKSATVKLTAFQRAAPENLWTGMAEHARDGARLGSEYGIRAWSARPGLREGQWQQVAGWRWERSLTLASLKSFVTEGATEADATWQAYGFLADRIPPPSQAAPGGLT